MSVGESLVVGLFILSLVFVVLAILYAMIMLLAAVLRPKAGKKLAVEGTGDLATAANSVDMGKVQTSSGAVRLKGVDERTAAMIMAIVSDESHIPLSELRFKSIRVVE